MQPAAKELYDKIINGEVINKLEYNHPLSSFETKHLNFALFHVDHLIKLDLTNCQLGLGGMKYLVTSLQSLENLEVLALGDNNLSPEGIHELCKALEFLSVLRVLNLYKNSIGVIGMRDLVLSLGGL